MHMTHAKTINKIRQRLDRAESAKEAKDKIFELVMIKVLVEGDIERLKQMSDKKQAAYNARTRIIKKALKQVLTALDKIFAKHDELGDTDVREQIYRVIYRGFIQPERGYSLPDKFGMFSDSGNSQVRAALQRFLLHPEVVAASKALKTPEDRFAAFQDDEAETSEGTNYIEYFGCSNQVRVA